MVAWVTLAGFYVARGYNQTSNPAKDSSSQEEDEVSNLYTAHCLAGFNTTSIRILLAPVSSVWATAANSPHSQIMEAEEIYIHEHYTGITFEADIAIIKTTHIAAITSHVHPVCFPFPGRENEQIERSQTSAGSVGVVTGFGVDET